jgi:hypothetical protein
MACSRGGRARNLSLLDFFLKQFKIEERREYTM